MLISRCAVLSLLLVINSISARMITHADINSFLATGAFDKEKLVSYAKPYRRAQENTDQIGDISTNTTIRFNTCMSLTVQDEELTTDSNLIEYAKEGKVVAEQSFVLFDTQDCEVGNCAFDESDLGNVYMVPLELFIIGMLNYYANNRAEYCETCSDFYSYCMGEGGAFYDTATNDNDGEFCYDGENYKLINCHQCMSYGCYGSNNNDAQYYQNEGNIGDWAEGITQCNDLGSAWNDYDLYSAVICNEDGDGIEFGVFLDEECRFYHKEKNFQKIAQGDDLQSYYMLPNVLKFMFTNSISCSSDSNVAYMSAYQEAQEDTGDCDEIDYINYGCSTLFSGYSLPLDTCAFNMNGTEYQDGGNGQGEQQGGYDGDYDNYNEAQNPYYNSWQTYGLYDYEVSQSQIYDEAAVCAVISNIYESGDHQNVYSTEGSGSLFDYTPSENDPDQRAGGRNEQSHFRFNAHFSFGEFIGISLLLFAVCVIGVFAFRRVHRMITRQKVIMEGKKDKLIDAETETVASNHDLA